MVSEAVEVGRPTSRVKSQRRWMLAAPSSRRAFSSGWPQRSFPERPIGLIVPFEPVAATDVIARQLPMGPRPVLGQHIVIANRAGANAIIGKQAMARPLPHKLRSVGRSRGVRVTGRHGAGRAKADPPRTKEEAHVIAAR